MRTLDDTLGSGIGWSLSPTSVDRHCQKKVWHKASDGQPTFKHVLDEHAALGDLLVDDELLIVGGDEKNHGSDEKSKGFKNGEDERTERLMQLQLW